MLFPAALTSLPPDPTVSDDEDDDDDDDDGDVERDWKNIAEAHRRGAVWAGLKLRWDFAIVFSAKRLPNEMDFEGKVKELCKRIVNSGLELGIAEKAPENEDKLVVLVYAPKRTMARAWRRLQRHRWVHSGVGISLSVAEAPATDAHQNEEGGGDSFAHSSTQQADDIRKRRMTAADRISAVAEILTEEVFDGFNTEWLSESGPGPTASYVDAVFPLSNGSWNKAFMGHWLRNPSVFVALGRDLCRALHITRAPAAREDASGGEGGGGGGPDPDHTPALHAEAEVHVSFWDRLFERDRWFIDQLKNQYVPLSDSARS